MPGQVRAVVSLPAALLTPMPYTDTVMSGLTFHSGQRATVPISLAIAGRPEERIAVVARVAAIGVRVAGGRLAGGVAWAAPVSVLVTHAVGPDEVLPISQLVRWKWPGPLLAVARVGAVLTDTGDDAGAKVEGKQAMSDMGNDGTGTSAPQDGEQRAGLAAHDRLLERIEGMFDRLLATARADACVGAAQAQGDRMVIPLAEVFAAGGFGGGVGSGQANAEAETGGAGSGGGGGGGGTSRSRPVAVIEVGPEGIHVRSVVDRTAIALAAVTAWGAMLLALGRMRKARRH